VAARSVRAVALGEMGKGDAVRAGVLVVVARKA